MDLDYGYRDYGWWIWIMDDGLGLCKIDWDYGYTVYGWWFISIFFREKHLFRSPGGKVFNSRKLAVQYLEENEILPTEELEKFRNGPKKRKRGKLPGRRKVQNIFSLVLKLISFCWNSIFLKFPIPPPLPHEYIDFLLCLNFLSLNAYF